MATEPDLSDRPFPGARPQVPGAHSGLPSHAEPRAPSPPRPLPLGATRTVSERGWSLRLPVRSEEVTLSKRVVVTERVIVSPHRIPETTRVEALIRRERLRIETEGQLEVQRLARESRGA